MENNLEAIIMGYIGFRVLGLEGQRATLGLQGTARSPKRFVSLHQCVAANPKCCGKATSKRLYFRPQP